MIQRFMLKGCIQFLTSKPLLKAQWRLLKFLFFISLVYFVGVSNDEIPFLALCFFLLLSLCFILATNTNPFLKFLGLLFTPITVPATIAWLALNRLRKIFFSGILINWRVLTNSTWLTSLRALIVSLFFLGFATLLTLKGHPNSPQWAVALYLNWSIGAFCTIQLICLCREPLAPVAALAEEMQRVITTTFESLQSNKGGAIGLMLSSGPIDKLFRKLSLWSENDSTYDHLKRLRTRLFVFLWFLLLFVGTIFFTNLFVLAGALPNPFDWKAYIDMFITVFTAMTGNLLGTIPQTLWFRAVFGALCMFQVATVVLLVLVYSVSIEGDVMRIRKAIALSSRKANDALLSSFEQLVRSEQSAIDCITIRIAPEVCRFRLPETAEWLSFGQLKGKKPIPSGPCRIKATVPIRYDSALLSSQVKFLSSPQEPPIIGEQAAKHVENLTYELPNLEGGICEMEFNGVIPSTETQLLCTLFLTYSEKTKKLAMLS